MSSETQTDSAESAESEHRETGANRGRKAAATWVPIGMGVALGWLVILHVNRWELDAPVVFLWAGWLAILLTGRYLWRAGMTAALDTTDAGFGDQDFWRPVGRRDELLRQKRSLLKAIKEIEFDHQMGKMSDQDAADLSSLYRRRAIEIIKVLGDGDGSAGKDLSVADEIEREVKARLELAGTQLTKAKGAAGESQAQAPSKTKSKAKKAKKKAADADASAKPAVSSEHKDAEVDVRKDADADADAGRPGAEAADLADKDDSDEAGAGIEDQEADVLQTPSQTNVRAEVGS